MTRCIDNFTLLTDFYELTMMNGYLEEGMADTVAYFEYFFRNVPDEAGFAICCGLESFIDYIEHLTFSESDLDYIRAKGIFTENFIERLRDFRFTGDIWAVREGTPIFPSEPIVVVRAKVFEAQLIETALLLFFNHQSLIATKASRIVRAADGRAVMEFGARRAQGIDASVMGARSCYIAGCVGSSNCVTDKLYGVPALGTMAHSWVQLFPGEYEAFLAYARSYPQNCSLLVDTYDVIKSGLPNAIRVFDEVLKPRGIRPKGVRIDSGDIAYLTKKMRKILDDAGYSDCPIICSNSLDEFIIRELLMQDAKIDSFGVGERMITSKSSPVFGGVYKLVAIEHEGRIINKIKKSENVEKITTPGFKQLWRLFNRDTGKAIADLVTFHDEIVDDTKPLEIFDPKDTWKRKTLENFRAETLLERIYEDGKLVFDSPSIKDIQLHCKKGLDYLWDEVKRFEYPHKYFVDLSYSLWKTKDDMIKSIDVKAEA